MGRRVGNSGAGGAMGLRNPSYAAESATSAEYAEPAMRERPDAPRGVTALVYPCVSGGGEEPRHFPDLPTFRYFSDPTIPTFPPTTRAYRVAVAHI